MTTTIGIYCDTYVDEYGICPTAAPDSGGTGGSYDRPYIGPALTYFGGQSLDAPSVNAPFPFPVALGGHTYVIDLKLYARSSVEPFREASDFNASPGEHSLTNEGAWKRNRSDWSWGAGQQWSDDPDSSERRFFASKGIDVWTPRELQLLPSTALAKATVGTNLKLLAVGDYLVLVDDTAILSTTDPEAGPYTTAVCAASVVDIATDGTTVYVAVSATGIYTLTPGASTVAAMGSDAATYNADLIGYANGWLIATNGPEIVSIAANGDTTVVWTHQNPGFEWTAVCAAANAIYIGGNAGEHNEIYQITVDQTNGGLAVPVAAGGVPDGETLNVMSYYQGALLLGTSRGLRVASIDGAGGASTGPLIDLERQIDALHSRGEFVWFGWRNYDADSTGLGRAKLSQFTSPLVPAYASDLMASEQGQIGGIATFNDRRYFTVDGSGLYGETTALVESGELDQGNLTYSVFEPKALMSVELITEPLNGQIALAVVDGLDTTTPIGTATTHGSTGVGQTYSGHNVVDEQLALHLTLSRAPATAYGPVVRRFSVRALPIPSNVELFTVPIIMKETVTVDVGEGQDETFDIGAEMDFLKNLERSRRPVTYQEGDHSYRVIVRSAQRPAGLTYTWNADRTAIEGIFQVLLSTLED